MIFRLYVKKSLPVGISGLFQTGNDLFLRNESAAALAANAIPDNVIQRRVSVRPGFRAAKITFAIRLRANHSLGLFAALKFTMTAFEK